MGGVFGYGMRIGWVCYGVMALRRESVCMGMVESYPARL